MDILSWWFHSCHWYIQLYNFANIIIFIYIFYEIKYFIIWTATFVDTFLYTTGYSRNIAQNKNSLGDILENMQVNNL